MVIRRLAPALLFCSALVTLPAYAAPLTLGSNVFEGSTMSVAVVDFELGAGQQIVGWTFEVTHYWLGIGTVAQPATYTDRKAGGGVGPFGPREIVADTVLTSTQVFDTAGTYGITVGAHALWIPYELCIMTPAGLQCDEARRIFPGGIEYRLDVEVDPTEGVPEPGAVALLGLALAGTATWLRRR